MAAYWTRRHVLATSVLASAAVGGGTLASGSLAAPLDEYAVLLTRWRDLLTGGAGVDPADPLFTERLRKIGADAAGFRDSMAPTDASLWPDQPLSQSASISGSLTRLRTMALAYASVGTGLTGDAALGTAIGRGLDHVYARAYNERTTFYGNWWDWQIGGPQRLLDACVLAHPALSEAQVAAYVRAVDHFVPNPVRMLIGVDSTGANRTDMCRVVALRGLLGKTAAKLADARDKLSPVFAYVTTGDGFYRDGSFVQHDNVPYTGTYGAVLIDGLSRLFSWLAGSSWEVTDPNRTIIHDAIERSYAPFLYSGLMMDAVRGRAISRYSASDHVDGHKAISHILRLAPSAPAAQAARFRALAKGWITRDTHLAYLGNRVIDVPDLAAAKALLADAGVPAAPETTRHRLFHNMDRAVHRRPQWAVSISLCSKRIAHYENMNGENLRGFHTGAGMLHVYGAGAALGQYADGFWPTVDPYRLTGVTASRKPLPDGAGGSHTSATPAWVGGATDGEFAAIGAQLAGVESTLRATKSWFCLDDAIVCLGAGITASDGTTVETTVDNRNLGATGTSALSVNGTAKPTTLGWNETMTGTRWAHLDGHGGYVFPTSVALRGLWAERTGRWRDINTGGPTETITRRNLTLWLDHGMDPSGAGYAYLHLPFATASAVAARAADTGWLQVLANTSRHQGIRVPSRGLTAANFFVAGSVGALAADGPASVLVRQSAGRAEIRVSDPSRTATTVDITWRHPVRRVLAKDPTVTVLATGPTLRLRIAVAGTAGAPHRTTVALR